MNGTNVTTHAEELHGRSLSKALAGGGSMEAVGGIATIVLAIIGLAGGMRTDMMAIATIILGASFILDGGAIAASFRKALFSLEGEGAEASDVSGAATFEFLAGFTGIVLGILALLGVGGAVNYLVSASIIVFGATLCLSSATVSRLQNFWSSATYSNELSRNFAEKASETGAGGHMLAGLAAIVLGILALSGINAVILNLVALLVLGVSVLLAGSQFGARSMLQSKRTNVAP